MPGLARERLVLVKAVVAPGGATALHVGTGYLVTGDLVLTAAHVVPLEGIVEIEVRTESDGSWRVVDLQPVWRDEVLDALLLRLAVPLPEATEVAWVEAAFDADARWQSCSYPDAGKTGEAGATLWKSVGLGGTLQALGGGGQGARELELTVDAPPPAPQWAGISGAPVFVGEQLAGFIKEVPTSFQGHRLAAVPATALLSNHGFRLALSRPWLDPLPEGAWVMVVQAEAKKGKTGLAEWVDGALTKHAKALKAVIGDGLQPKPVHVPICEALESPGRWLRFVRALCSAPIVLFDATDFEPAVMLALGVRAVVRRGLTLTSSAEVMSPSQLAQLPFNIQETKLLHHGSGYKASDDRHPLTAIAAAIRRGWQELASQPAYLDLPAYDAVRCPYPTADAEGDSAIERMLVLCPFAVGHEPNWLHVSNALLARYPDRKVARMLDVASPRLVGQALYEGIRWARTCVADWTGWRGNVFFELGVRLACADVAPVSLIEETAAQAAMAPGAPAQGRLLMALLRPAIYRVDPADENVDVALSLHDAIVEQRPPAVAASALPPDATFMTCADHFEWRQEHITTPPHELLRSTIEAPFGKDPQAGGRSPLLFSGNGGYGRDLERSVKERWIAAWCYLVQRYPQAQWAVDAPLRAALRRLGNDVLQFGLPAPAEAHLLDMRERVFDVMDALDLIDAQTTGGAGHAVTDR